MENLSNGILTIGVNEHGAELCSLQRNGREYLWQADKAFWQRHSPVLFPVVGSLWQGKYHTGGREYAMGQHGFARDMDFELMSRSTDTLRYRLCSSEQTRARFPWDFLLEIAYRLEGNRVRVMWDVTNTGTLSLPFQIGAHPAFYWPMLSAQSIAEGTAAMAPALAATDRRGYFRLETAARTLPVSLVSEGGCFGAQSELTLEPGGYMPLTVDTFARDAIVVEDSLVTGVSLCDEERRPFVTMEFESPLVGLWSPPGKRAPFVCIEPWYGRADSVGYTGDFSCRKWMQHLAPSESFHASYTIAVE